MVKSRETNQKHLILEAIKHLDHPTCDEIYLEVLKLDSTIGRATVFRNVKLLTDKKILTKIIMPQGALRYDISVQNHSHFVCDCCGKIYDMDYLPNISLPNLPDFKIQDYKLIFTGLCKECQKKER